MELEQQKSRIAAEGLGLASISYDTVAILRDFALRRHITFPMLADPDSSIIRRFGLFNDTIDPSSRDYGIPYPGTFITDAAGVVRHKIFEEHYMHRLPVATLLTRMGRASVPAAGPVTRLEYLEVHTGATEQTLSPGNAFTLFVDIRPNPGVHVYAPGVSEYQGAAVTITPQPFFTVRGVQYPEAQALPLPVIGETLLVYDHPIRIAVDVALGSRQDLAPILEGDQRLSVEGTLSLQACDDRICWPPQEIGLSWTFPLRPPDLDRSPEPLRHQPRPPAAATD